MCYILEFFLFVFLFSSPHTVKDRRIAPQPGALCGTAVFQFVLCWCWLSINRQRSPSGRYTHLDVDCFPVLRYIPVTLDMCCFKNNAYGTISVSVDKSHHQQCQEYHVHASSTLLLCHWNVLFFCATRWLGRSPVTEYGWTTSSVLSHCCGVYISIIIFYSRNKYPIFSTFGEPKLFSNVLTRHCPRQTSSLTTA